VGKVVANAIMSLDGYVAKQDNTIGRLFDWLQNGEVAIPTPAGDFTVHLTPASAEHWKRWTSSLGALVCGRELFDVPGAPLPEPETPAPPRFLPAFDNSLLSHSDRARIIPDEHRKLLIKDPLMRGVLLDGFVCATWKIERSRGSPALPL